MNYEKVWQRMNALEEAFNRIGSVEFLIEKIDDHLSKDNVEEAKVALHALKAFLPVLVEDYDEASRKAWNDIVLPTKTEEIRNRPVFDLDAKNYNEICQYLNEEMYPTHADYNSFYDESMNETVDWEHMNVGK
jgi:hypothetical protein